MDKATDKIVVRVTKKNIALRFVSLGYPFADPGPPYVMEQTTPPGDCDWVEVDPEDGVGPSYIVGG